MEGKTFTTTSLYAKKNGSVEKDSSKKKKGPVPVSLLSGFLGTGKTTALKHLLENSVDLKIGVIVNDVASVNIDAKLVNSDKTDVLELQNGCACCSLADELFDSVEAISRNRELDAIVVELSGVADPAAIQANWKMAPAMIREKAVLQRVVTLVDATTFGSDYMTWDVAGDRPSWVPKDEGSGVILDECAANRKVSELLAEQVEAAHLILVNKVDLAAPEEVEIATKVAKALNSKAKVVAVEFGKTDPRLVLGVNNDGSMDNTHLHAEEQVCEDAGCTDTSHSHSHSHEAAVCADAECTDTSHSHSHSHSDETTACADPECTDTSHSHSHSHSDDETTACADPDCTDTSHSHSHSHATSTDQLGITSFVYKAAVPFDAVRLMAVLSSWPIPIKETLDLGLLYEAQEDGYELGGKRMNAGDSPFLGVIRSKGFCWFAPGRWSGAADDAWRHDTAMYWSHAGKHFGISSAGKWWGTLSKDKMAKYFVENESEYERILREDFVSDEFADRRQEIVFIGTNLDEAKIRETLDDCLLTDKELERYRQNLRNYQDSIFTTSATSRGLFDVGGVDHLDANQ